MGAGQPSSQSLGAIGEERAIREAPCPVHVACVSPSHCPFLPRRAGSRRGVGKMEVLGGFPGPEKTNEFPLWASGMSFIHSFMHSCLCRI